MYVKYISIQLEEKYLLHMKIAYMWEGQSPYICERLRDRKVKWSTHAILN